MKLSREDPMPLRILKLLVAAACTSTSWPVPVRYRKYWMRAPCRSVNARTMQVRYKWGWVYRYHRMSTIGSYQLSCTSSVQRTAQGVDQKFLRRVDRGLPTVDLEFRSGFPLLTQHHCVIRSKTTLLRYTILPVLLRFSFALSQEKSERRGTGTRTRRPAHRYVNLQSTRTGTPTFQSPKYEARTGTGRILRQPVGSY